MVPAGSHTWSLTSPRSHSATHFLCGPPRTGVAPECSPAPQRLRGSRGGGGRGKLRGPHEPTARLCAVTLGHSLTHVLLLGRRGQGHHVPGFVRGLRERMPTVQQDWLQNLRGPEKVKLWDPLFTNYEEFQGGDSSAWE